GFDELENSSLPLLTCAAACPGVSQRIILRNFGLFELEDTFPTGDNESAAITFGVSLFTSPNVDPLPIEWKIVLPLAGGTPSGTSTPARNPTTGGVTVPSTFEDPTNLTDGKYFLTLLEVDLLYQQPAGNTNQYQFDLGSLTISLDADQIRAVDEPSSLILLASTFLLISANLGRLAQSPSVDRPHEFSTQRRLVDLRFDMSAV